MFPPCKRVLTSATNKACLGYCKALQMQQKPIGICDNESGVINDQNAEENDENEEN